MNQDEQLLQELKQAVLDNLENEQFSVEHLSQMVGVSRSHLHRRLKKLKGQSISQFIREIRLAEALKLLRKDVATTSEIAYKVGFNSPSYFHKCFLEYYGYPPSEAKHKFQNQPLNEDIKGEAIADPPTVSKPEKKQNYNKYKSITFPIIALLFIAYASFYFWNEFKTVSPLEKSIAVLPFNSLSEDEENQHFADGLVEDLLSRLVLINEFKVISRTSSDTYRERGKKTVPEIASKLGVSYIVEGSVQKHDNKARITVQLIDAINDDHIWIKTFDKDIADVFKIQSEIAVQVASGLSTVLTEQQTIDIQKSQTENIKAFEWYQLGRHHWNYRTEEGLLTSINYFERAIEEDSTFALAIANMADSYFLLSFLKEEDKEYVKKAELLASKALGIDSHLPEAYNVLGGIYSFIELDWDAAEKVFLQGLKYNPNHSNLHHRYSEHLRQTGRLKESRIHINRAIELDPLSFVIRSISAALYCGRGLFEESLAEVKICHELIPDKYHPRIAGLSFELYYQLGDEQSALEHLKHWDDKTLNSKPTPEVWDSIYNVSGMNGLIKYKAELTIYPFEKANLYGLCGDYEKAMDWLEISYESDPASLQDMLFFYNFKSLNSNPRFIALLKKMNLPWSPDSSD